MNDLKIPNGHQVVMPYLIIPNANKFIDFAVTVFGAKETHRSMTDTQEVRHAELVIGNSTIMLGQSNEQWSAIPASLFVYTANPDDSFNKAIKQGATVVMPMEDKDYGRAGGVQDPFGNTWWITGVQNK